MALFKILRGNAANLPTTKKDGYAYFCTDTHDFYIDYTKADGSLDRAQLNAYAADKLTTGRKITLGTAVTTASTAPTFDGSKNIEIPISGLKEAYLEWGGKNRQAYSKLSPIDYLFSAKMKGNKLAFLPEECIKFESSTDGGTTWTEFTNTTAKRNLFSVGGATIRIGNADNTGYTDKSNYQVRITINAWGNGAEGTNSKTYASLYKFLINCSTNGSEGCWVTIETRTRANYLAGKDTWGTQCTQQTINGWSGTNSINTNAITFGGGSTQTSQTGEIRFTFGVVNHPATSQYGGLIINFIEGYGGDSWTHHSNMASTGHLYSYDYLQNATFPASIIQNSSAHEIYSKGALKANGATTLGSTLNVTGKTTLKETATGALTASSVSSTGALSVTGNSTLSGNLTVKGNTTLGDATSDTVTIKGPVSAEARLTTNFLIVNNSSSFGGDLATHKMDIDSKIKVGTDLDETRTTDLLDVYGGILCNALHVYGGVNIDDDLDVDGASYLNNTEITGYLDLIDSSDIYLYDEDGATRAEIGHIFKNTGGFQVEDIDENTMYSVLNKTQLLIRKIENGTATNMIQAKNDGTLKATTSVTSPSFIGDLTGNADTADEAYSLTWSYFDATGTIS